MNQIEIDCFPLVRVVEVLFLIDNRSMTRLLEHAVHGRVQEQILFQAIYSLAHRLTVLPLDKGQLMMKKRALIQQKETDKTLLFATLMIVPAILPPSILQSIQQQNVPVCQQILPCKERRAGVLLADSYAVGSQTACCAR